MAAVKPKRSQLKIGWNIDPVSIAAGNLSKALDRFTWITPDIRKGWVEEMKLLPYLTHLNMQVLASTLVLYESVESIQTIPTQGVSNRGQDIIAFLQRIEARMPPTVTRTMTGIDLAGQELYDEITRPLLEDIGDKNLTNEQINDILIKMKATLFRYSVNLYNYRNEI